MAKKPLPSPDVLRQLLTYDPETGKLFWKPRGIEWFKEGNTSRKANHAAWHKKHAGQEAFYTIGNAGYYQGIVLYTQLRAHRVAWAIYYGEWPELVIDHINGDPLDNRIANLLQATISQNGYNRGAPKHNTSGHKGVYWNGKEKKWHVQLNANRKRISVGYFRTKEEAAAAYAAAAVKYHGNFARPT